MKRDWDLVRAILQAMEATANRFDNPEIPNVTDEELQFHLGLLRDAGLIERLESGTAQFKIVSYRLTWNGCEFLEAAREKTRWDATRKTIANAGGATFEVLKQILVESLRKSLGL